jgi:hypothetical protein
MQFVVQLRCAAASEQLGGGRAERIERLETSVELHARPMASAHIVVPRDWGVAFSEELSQTNVLLRRLVAREF